MAMILDNCKICGKHKMVFKDAVFAFNGLCAECDGKMDIFCGMHITPTEKSFKEEFQKDCYKASKYWHKEFSI